MADNVDITAGAGTTIRTDDVGGVQYPASKLVVGADGVDDGFVSTANPLPVTGTLAVTGALTDAELRAVPVPVSGTGTSTSVGRPAKPPPPAAKTRPEVPKSPDQKPDISEMVDRWVGGVRSMGVYVALGQLGKSWNTTDLEMGEELLSRTAGKGLYPPGTEESVDFFARAMAPITRAIRFSAARTVIWVHRYKLDFPSMHMLDLQSVFIAWLRTFRIFHEEDLSSFGSEVCAFFVKFAFENSESSGRSVDEWFEALVADLNSGRWADPALVSALPPLPKVKLRNVETSDEVAMRFHYYAQIIETVTDPDESGELIFAIEKGVIPKNQRPDFLDRRFWPSFEKSFRISFRKSASAREPIFGKDSFWRRVEIDCDSWLDRVRNRAAACQITDGKGCYSVFFVTSSEMAINDIQAQLNYDLTLSNMALRNGLDASGSLRGRLSKEDYAKYVKTFATDEAIEEARRRFDASPVGMEIRDLLAAR